MVIGYDINLPASLEKSEPKFYETLFDLAGWLKMDTLNKIFMAALKIRTIWQNRIKYSKWSYYSNTVMMLVLLGVIILKLCVLTETLMNPRKHKEEMT